MHADSQTADVNFDSLTGRMVKVGGSVLFWAIKRLADVLLCLILVPAVLFFVLALALINPLFNRGPLFYTQTRFGKDMAEFRMWKFRTMVGSSDDSKFATQEQFRITSMGAFLRNKHIDELPQIWNVIKGDMSIIGPRPEQKRFVMEYLEHIPSYKDRHLIRPGVTGLAQVELGYTDDLHGTRDKLSYDLDYIKNSGIKMELSIVLKTVVLIFSRFLKP